MPRNCILPGIFVCLAFLPLVSCKAPVPDEPGGGTLMLPSAPAPVETETVVGRITLLGADNAFVVFQSEDGAAVGIGEELRVRFSGAPVGRIKVTPPDKKNGFHAADVIEGTMEKGYEVVRVKRSEAAPQAGAAVQP